MYGKCVWKPYGHVCSTVWATSGASLVRSKWPCLCSAALRRFTSTRASRSKRAALHEAPLEDPPRFGKETLETVKFNLLNLLPGTIARRDLLVALTSLLNFCCLSLLMSAIVSLSILSNFNCSSAGPQRQPLLLQLPQPCRLTKDRLGT